MHTVGNKMEVIIARLTQTENLAVSVAQLKECLLCMPEALGLIQYYILQDQKYEKINSNVNNSFYLSLHLIILTLFLQQNQIFIKCIYISVCVHNGNWRQKPVRWERTIPKSNCSVSGLTGGQQCQSSGSWFFLSSFACLREHY